MKKNLLLVCILFISAVKAQKIDSIYVNLYTDSLKKGTYNYINVDGLMTNGRYLPLDSLQINFEASAGKFLGNSLWVNPDYNDEKILITVTCRQNPTLKKSFTMFIKKKPDDEQLKSVDELLNDMRQQTKQKKRNNYLAENE